MNTNRVVLSKRQRFEVFKRDNFTCQYCGRKPPDVILEVDHVCAVVSGGTNEDYNLLTSCFDCNRGKGSSPIKVIPIDIEERRLLAEERRDQVRAYEETLQHIREENEARIDAVISTYETSIYDYYCRLNRTRTLEEQEPAYVGFSRVSIRNFLKLLPLPVVQEAMEIACDKMIDGRISSNELFRYFCGICWNKIKKIKIDNGEI